MKLFAGHIAYILVLTAVAFNMPAELWDPEAAQFILVIGIIAVWRYGWAVVNWVRFIIYNNIVFPRWRKKTTQMGDDWLPDHVYLLVTSFRIGAETTKLVYNSVVEEAINYGRPVTIVVSVVERGDQTFIRHIYESYNPPEHVKLVFVRIAGTGKRDALACGFRAISKLNPPANSVSAVIDGDSMLEAGLIRKCAPFFSMFPRLGALTTDEVCEVEGNNLFRTWYNLRFAQRHIFMGSVSLSKRVLTLTGRMSMFRTEILCDPKFIERVELDWVDHWRLGRFKFLTGDDKSSWYHTLSQGYEMLYIPDVKVLTIETPPHPEFVKCSIVLMRRWFGNMLRTNSRALRLSPRTIGWFPWLSIFDQRISMWTSLTGPVVAILATLFATPLTLLYYFIWVAITRYTVTLSLLAGRQRVSAAYPFFLYYNQIIGSLVKTYVLFRLDKQRWTRQNTTLATGKSAWAERKAAYASTAMHVFSMTVYITALATVSGILPLPDLQFWADLIL